MSRLTPISSRRHDGSYRVSDNGRVRLPAAWLAVWNIEPGVHSVWMYVNQDGDLVVRNREHKVDGGDE